MRPINRYVEIKLLISDDFFSDENKSKNKGEVLAISDEIDNPKIIIGDIVYFQEFSAKQSGDRTFILYENILAKGGKQ